MWWALPSLVDYYWICGIHDPDNMGLICFFFLLTCYVGETIHLYCHGIWFGWFYLDERWTFYCSLGMPIKLDVNTRDEVDFCYCCCPTLPLSTLFEMGHNEVQQGRNNSSIDGPWPPGSRDPAVSSWSPHMTHFLNLGCVKMWLWCISDLKGVLWQMW